MFEAGINERTTKSRYASYDREIRGLMAGDRMAISFFRFAESEKGAARWYSKDLGQPICFVENADELESSGADTYVILADKTEANLLNELKEKEANDPLHKYVFVTNADIEAQYTQMMNARDAAIKTVSHTISPETFFEYYLVSCQIEGFYITNVECSDDFTEKYIWGYHRDSHQTLFVAVSMDGHYITNEVIESRGKNQHIKRYAEYSDRMCMNMVDNMHFRQEFENIYGLPRELTDLKNESDRVLDLFDIYYLGGSVNKELAMDVADVIGVFIENERGEIPETTLEKAKTLEIYNVTKIKGQSVLQEILADAIDVVCENGGKVIINDMGKCVSGYRVLNERIEGYDSDKICVNPYGCL